MSHTVTPRLDRRYRARDLPSGSVVRHPGAIPGATEYVIGRTRLCMRWEQPIPGSDEWVVIYVGRLAPGEWMTPRERAEVDEAPDRPAVPATAPHPSLPPVLPPTGV